MTFPELSNAIKNNDIAEKTTVFVEGSVTTSLALQSYCVCHNWVFLNDVSRIG